MLQLKDYARIRRAHRDGMSVRAIARQFGHSRRKVREVLKQPEPKPYTRTKPAHAPKLTEQFQQRIEEILQEDESAPRKQRHTAVLIFRRLSEEGYTGGYDQVRRFVAKRRRTDRETFLPLDHQPGERVECDFGHIYVDFPEGRRLVAVLIVTWAWSNATFAIALPSEKTEAIQHGTVAAFEFFGCVPRELWWDNPKTVATEILQGRQRELNQNYQTLASHYNFDPQFCMPARGNEKPRVEGRVKFLQRNWATPVPQMRHLEELNQHLLACCQRDQQRTVSGQQEGIGARLEEERQRAMSLPDRAFDACSTEARRVDKYQTVAWAKNRYSVPRNCAFHAVSVKAYVHEIVIVSDGQIVARHPRSYGDGELILDPLHFLNTLSRKPAYLDRTAVYKSWKLPAEFGWLRDHLESRLGKMTGSRHFVRVLQLLASHPLERVQQAIIFCRREEVTTAERVTHQCQRLAEREAAAELTDAASHRTSGSRPPGNGKREEASARAAAVEVPRPDLTQYDRLLNPVTHGVEPSDNIRHSPAIESEPQAAPAADDAGRTQQAGAGGGSGQSGLPGIPAAADRAGAGDAVFQRAAITHPSGGLPGPQGSRHV